MKIIYVNCGLINVDESDLCRNEHYPSSIENKAWKKIQAFAGYEPMICAIPDIDSSLHGFIVSQRNG